MTSSWQLKNLHRRGDQQAQMVVLDMCKYPLAGINREVFRGLQVSNTALNTSENILMCAPTGAGKTNVAMLAILHTMSLYRNAETGKIDTSKFKIVYVAPMKVCSGPSMMLHIRIRQSHSDVPHD